MKKSIYRMSLCATYGEAENGCILYGMGITQHATGVENTVNLCNLAMLTGNFGRPGTGVNVQGAGDMGVLPDCFTGYTKT